MKSAHSGIGDFQVAWHSLPKTEHVLVENTKTITPMKTSLKLLAVAAAFATVASSQAALLVYENFQGSNYVAGSTMIGVAAQGTGLTGNWTRSAGSTDANWMISNSSAMSYTSGNVSVSGGTKYGAGSWVGTATEVANIQLSSGLAFASQPFYMSFLVRYNGALDVNDQMSLHTANTDGITSITRAGVRDNTPSPTGDVAFLANQSSTTYLNSPTLSAGTTYFMVMKLDNNSGAWRGTLWLNPNSTTVEGGGALGSVTAAIGGTSTINYLGFKMANADAGDSLNLDEIRIGQTWADVAVPEPATWALLAVVGTFFMVTRRRRKIG